VQWITCRNYLSKPFNPTLLRARVHASLEKKSLRDAVKRHLERLEKELDAARKLQMSMVPTFFPEPSAERPLEIFAVMEPAREVGGDFYDFFYDDEGVLFFAIADVSGKGVPAAMFMARAKNLLRFVTSMMQRGGGRVSAASVVSQVNRELCLDNDTMMFVTLIFGWFDPKTGVGELCNAGHDAAIRVSGASVAAISGPQGMALGINPEWPYESIPFALEPEEMLFFYTDGVSEAANAANELFTRPRLEDVLRDSRAQPLSEMANTMMRAVRTFAAGAEQSDDITSLSIRYLSGF
jgi:sigma-B regulation protein RsbU (phosphoserine phosphatase)